MKELTIEISDKCSLNCLQCSTEAGSDGTIYFSLEQIKSILEKYNNFKAVRLSGGEPLEHPQLTEIVRLIAQQNKEAYILSCGVKERKAISIRDKALDKAPAVVGRLVIDDNDFPGYRLTCQVVVYLVQDTSL